MRRVELSQPVLPVFAGGVSGQSAHGFSSELARARADIERTVANGFAPRVPQLRSMNEPVRQPARTVVGTSPRPAAASGPELAERAAFLRDIAPWSERAAASLGVSPQLVAGHAALESGWGKSAIPGDSHNLFGVKATGWSGRSVAATTTEVLDGKAVRTTENFRAYSDYSEAFDDYARLLGTADRYARVSKAGNDAQAFARAVARGGYATDPGYEKKLVDVIRDVRRISGVVGR